MGWWHSQYMEKKMFQTTNQQLNQQLAHFVAGLTSVSLVYNPPAGTARGKSCVCWKMAAMKRSLYLEIHIKWNSDSDSDSLTEIVMQYSLWIVYDYNPKTIIVIMHPMATRMGKVDVPCIWWLFFGRHHGSSHLPWFLRLNGVLEGCRAWQIDVGEPVQDLSWSNRKDWPGKLECHTL